jgi:pilus assembly protein CpaF
LMADDTITDIMVNGPGRVWVERGGVVEPTSVMLDRPTIDHLIERMVGPIGRRVDRTSPLVDARLGDGSRVHVVVPPLAVDGPYVTVRRFRTLPVRVEHMAAPAVVELLRQAVARESNIVVTGGTGSGKTTLLNALSRLVPPGDRIVTIEDAAELRLLVDHVVRLEARPLSLDGPAPVTVRDLVRAALRMRPDRIVVGEVRGAEALDMLQAMNTGHDGSMPTCHANSPADALRRLEVMVMTGSAGLPLGAVRRLIGAAVDLVVHVERLASGERRVVGVAEPSLDGEDVANLMGDGAVRRPIRPARRSMPATERMGQVG